MLTSHDANFSKSSLDKPPKRYEIYRSIHRKPGSDRLSSITAEIKALVEQQMQTDDETTAYQLHKLLTSRGYKVSVRTVLRCRKALRWTFRGSAYCQLIDTRCQQGEEADLGERESQRHIC